MSTNDQDQDKDKDFRVAPGFSAAEIKRQEYRSLCFWANLTSVAIAVLVIATLVTLGGAFPLLAIAVVARMAMAMAKVYYRNVYKIDE